MRGIRAALLISACLYGGNALAQEPGSGAQAPTSLGVIGVPNGHLSVFCGGLPTITNATLDDGSNDCAGSYVASSTSGALTFGAPYIRTPLCSVDSATTTQAAYTVTPVGITITTEVSGTRYTYTCFAKPGG